MRQVDRQQFEFQKLGAIRLWNYSFLGGPVELCKNNSTLREEMAVCDGVDIVEADRSKYPPEKAELPEIGRFRHKVAQMPQLRYSTNAKAGNNRCFIAKSAFVYSLVCPIVADSAPIKIVSGETAA